MIICNLLPDHKVSRILQVYDKNSFVFMQNFTRIVFYKNSGQIELTPRQKEILTFIKKDPKISRELLSKSLIILTIDFS
jgi:hypothetical protein